jgi:protein-disulfide isomerase
MNRMSRRAWLISGAAVVAIIVVVVAIVVSVSGGDSSSDSSASGGGSVTGASAVLAMTKGIPQSGFTIGKASAPVKVKEFLDPQCPICKKASTDAVPALVKGPVKAGEASLTIEPLTFIGSDSTTAALAIAAAAQQNRGFVYSDIAYANQGTENSGWVTEDLLAGIASAIPGFDVAKWQTARAAQPASDAVFAAGDAAKNAGVNATPTFVITGPGGTKTLTGAIPGSQLLAAVKSVS